MQCHKCPLNGNPSEKCLSCKSADYLDNDHKTVIPVDDIQKVSSHIDSAYYDRAGGNKNDKPITDGQTKKNMEDCENVLKVLKKCDKSSFKHIACLVALFLSLGNSAPILSSMLEGESFVECAEKLSVSKQSVQQTWNRLVQENHILSSIKSRKRQNKMILK